MIATLQPAPVELWRKRLGGRRRNRTEPRPLAALGYLADSPVQCGLIEVENLSLVVLYDDLIRPEHCALRLAGYTGSRVPWGVRFGGPENCRFRKDLFLQPVPGGRGYRLDVADEELLSLGLGLERELDRCERFCHRQVRNRPCLPKLWAAFRPNDAGTITGDGPELAAYAERTGRSCRSLLHHLRREHQGLILLPLAWVSHHWEQTIAVLADLDGLPRQQVFRLRQADEDLAGYQGAMEFDFVSRPHRMKDGPKAPGCVSALV